MSLQPLNSISSWMASIAMVWMSSKAYDFTIPFATYGHDANNPHMTRPIPSTEVIKDAVFSKKRLVVRQILCIGLPGRGKGFDLTAMINLSD